MLTQLPRAEASAQAIDTGYGAAVIAGFVARETRNGVIVIGGLPVDYNTAIRPAAVLSTLAAVYTEHGGKFTILPDQSEYPRSDFFNSEDHLAKPCQYLHSIYVAARLAALLQRPIRSPSAAVRQVASACPSAAD